MGRAHEDVVECSSGTWVNTSVPQVEAATVNERCVAATTECSVDLDVIT